MPRTPDYFPGDREEEGILFLSGSSPPSKNGEVRYISGSGFQFCEEGAIKTLGSVYTQRFILNGKPKVVTSLDGAWIAPFSGTISRVTMFRRISGSSGVLTMDVNKNATTIYTTQANRPAISSSAGNNATTSSVPNVTTFMPDDRFEVDIDTIEAGNALDVTLNLTVQFT